MSNQTATNPPEEEPPPAMNPGSGRKPRTRKKKSARPSEPSARYDKRAVNPEKQSGFGDGNKVLESFGLGVSGRFEEVYSAPNTEGYFNLVDQCYEELCSVKPEVRFVFTRSEWMHVHALMFYARTSEVFAQVTGKKQPPPTRIPLPYDVRVFQPIWAILSDIGVVEDSDLKVRYIPYPKLPETEAIDSPEDIAAVLACTGYDWKTSWSAVEADRQLLDAARVSEGLLPLTMVENTPKPLTRNQTEEIVTLLAELKELERAAPPDTAALLAAFDGLSSPVGVKDSSGFISYTIDFGGIKIDENVRTLQEITSAYTAIATAVKAAKSKKILRKYPEPTTGSTTFTFDSEDVPNDPGTYGARLHWDPRLWEQLRHVCDLVCPISLWSPSFPREKNGTYMWVLPREQGSAGFFMLMPKVDIPTPVWILGLILNMSNLPIQRKCMFYVHSDVTQSFILMRKGYISAAIKSGLATEQFR